MRHERSEKIRGWHGDDFWRQRIAFDAKLEEVVAKMKEFRRKRSDVIVFDGKRFESDESSEIGRENGDSIVIEVKLFELHHLSDDGRQIGDDIAIEKKELEECEAANLDGELCETIGRETKEFEEAQSRDGLREGQNAIVVEDENFESDHLADLFGDL